ncbi:MAG: TonB-dependent receptor, partial [Planctomycetota bacterium]
NALTLFEESVQGGNALFRHSQQSHDDTGWTLQAYAEATDRILVGAGARYSRQRIDIDFQNRVKPWDNHEIIYGLGYRHTWDQFTNQPYFFSLNPEDRQYDTVSGFAQDTLTLLEDQWYLSIGSKLSHNDFSGGEVQPSIRMLLTPNESTSAWASVSQAIRTPSRLVANGRVTLPAVSIGNANAYPVIRGNDQLAAENIIAYEIGLRRQQTDSFGWDVAMFYNHYTDIIGTVAAGGITTGTEGLIIPQQFVNNAFANSWGVEIAATYQPHNDWTLRSTFSYLDLNISGTRLTQAGDSPQHQVTFHSSHALSSHVDLDLIYRYVDSLPNQQVPSYGVADVRLAIRPSRSTELFVVGQNLLDGHRREFGNDPFAGTQSVFLPRGVYGGFTIRL